MSTFEEVIRDSLSSSHATVGHPVDTLAEHVTADHVTIAGVALAATTVALSALGTPKLAGTSWALSGSADALDGAVARARTRNGLMNSPSGALLDSVTDRVSDSLAAAAVIAAATRRGRRSTVVAAAAAGLAASWVPYVRAKATAERVPTDVVSGGASRAVRHAAWGVAIISPRTATPICVAIAISSAATTRARLRAARAHLDDAPTLAG